MTTPDHSGFGSFALLLAFAGGALIGGAAAVLWAPRSGKETRRRVAEAIDDGRGMASRVPQAFRDATGAAKEAFTDALEDSA
jgi:gas vesicle protein